MFNIFKNSIFWKKFTRFLILGLSIFVILAAFKVGESSEVSADYSCPTATGIATMNTPLNNQSLASGTSSVLVSWDAAPYAQTYSITATNTTTQSVIYSDADFSGTTFTLSPLVNGNYYRVLIMPKNNCGNGTSSEVAFSVGTSVTSCSNTGQCIWCGSGEDREQICPEVGNNCTATCPGQNQGTLSCNINQQLNNPLGPAPYTYNLSANPTNFLSYRWDFTNDNSFDNSGQSVQQQFYSDTTTRLEVRDSLGNVGTCYTNIDVPSTSTGNDVPTCNINSSNTSGNAPLSASFTVSATAYLGKTINRYEWDIDGNNSFGDNPPGNSTSAAYTYYQDTTVRVRVFDSGGLNNICTRSVNVNSSGSCTHDVTQCPDGSSVGRDSSNNCQFFQCPNTGNNCRFMTCPAAPSGCSYTGQLTTSCNPNAILTCGTLIGNCSSTSTSTTITPGNGTTIVNTNSSSSSSSSSNNNNNNITIK